MKELRNVVTNLMMEPTTKRQLRTILSAKTFDSWLVAADLCEESGLDDEAIRLRVVGTLGMRLEAMVRPSEIGYLTTKCFDERCNGKPVRFRVWDHDEQRQLMAFELIDSSFGLTTSGRLASRRLDKWRLDAPGYAYRKCLEVMKAAGVDVGLPGTVVSGE